MQMTLFTDTEQPQPEPTAQKDINLFKREMSFKF